MKIAKVDYGALIKQAWEFFKKEWAFFVVAMLVTLIVSVASDALGYRTDENGVSSGNFVFNIVFFLITLLVQIGYQRGAINLVRGKEIAMGDIFSGYKPFEVYIKYFLNYILTGFIFIIGFILLVIPGIIAVVRLGFAPYIVIDKGLGPIEAIKESWRITSGNFWTIFVFILLLICINILGALALLIGLIVTIPLSTIAYTVFYKYLMDAHTQNESANDAAEPIVTPAEAGYTDVA